MAAQRVIRTLGIHFYAADASGRSFGNNFGRNGGVKLKPVNSIYPYLEKRAMFNRVDLYEDKAT